MSAHAPLTLGDAHTWNTPEPQTSESLGYWYTDELNQLGQAGCLLPEPQKSWLIIDK